MDQKKLENLKDWFESYVSSYYGISDHTDQNVKLKHLHTHKVCEEMKLLTNSLGVSEESANIAETIALLHDIGRFEQVKLYKTFEDSQSVDHALLALEIIEEQKILSEVSVKTQEIIKTAIEHHNKLSLNIDDEIYLMYAKLIRDADKIDIYRVVIAGYLEYIKNPAAFKVAIGFKDESEGKCTPEVLDAVLNQKNIPYTSLKTLNDRKLLQLGWIYDLNFTHSIKRVMDMGHIDFIFKHLPDTDEIVSVKNAIYDYVSKRTQNQ